MIKMLSQTDRLKILKIIYDEQRTSSKKIEEKTGFSKEDVVSTCKYLEGKNLIECRAKVMGGDILDIRITSDGIDVIENNKEIIKKFEAGVNLGIINIKWGVQEK